MLKTVDTLRRMCDDVGVIETTTKGNDMHDPHNITARDLTPLDELTNDELVAHERLYDTATILTEWDRVSGVIADNVMTGRDMSYFLNRDDILRALATNRGYTG